MILYHTGCVNFYPKDGQDWLHFVFKIHNITISSIIPQRPNGFKSKDFNHCPFLKYTCIIYIFSTEIIIIFNCDGVAATQHNICTFDHTKYQRDALNNIYSSNILLYMFRVSSTHLQEEQLYVSSIWYRHSL